MGTGWGSTSTMEVLDPKLHSDPEERRGLGMCARGTETHGRLDEGGPGAGMEGPCPGTVRLICPQKLRVSSIMTMGATRAARRRRDRHTLPAAASRSRPGSQHSVGRFDDPHAHIAWWCSRANTALTFFLHLCNIVHWREVRARSRLRAAQQAARTRAVRRNRARLGW